MALSPPTPLSSPSPSPNSPRPPLPLPPPTACPAHHTGRGGGSAFLPPPPSVGCSLPTPPGQTHSVLPQAHPFAFWPHLPGVPLPLGALRPLSLPPTLPPSPGGDWWGRLCDPAIQPLGTEQILGSWPPPSLTLGPWTWQVGFLSLTWHGHRAQPSGDRALRLCTPGLAQQQPLLGSAASRVGTVGVGRTLGPREGRPSPAPRRPPVCGRSSGGLPQISPLQGCLGSKAMVPLPSRALPGWHKAGHLCHFLGKGRGRWVSAGFSEPGPVWDVHKGVLNGALWHLGLRTWGQLRVRHPPPLPPCHCRPPPCRVPLLEQKPWCRPFSLGTLENVRLACGF